MVVAINLRTGTGASSHGTAAASPDSRALQYQAGLIYYQPQPAPVMQKRQAKPPSIFPDALLAPGGKTSAAQLLQYLLGLESQVRRNHRGIQADSALRQLREIHCVRHV
jgi:hypothetical protein